MTTLGASKRVKYPGGKNSPGVAQRIISANRRQRETRRRRITTFAGRIRRADDHELQWLAGLLDAEMDRRRLEYSDADFRGEVFRTGGDAELCAADSRGEATPTSSPAGGRVFADGRKIGRKFAAGG